MKAYVATLGTETNSFIEFPTTLKQFQDCCLFHKGEYSDPPNMLSMLQIRLAARLKDKGYQVEHGLCAFGNVSGIVTDEAYRALCDEVYAEVEAYQPDMVLCFIHGAMVSESHLDAEGVFLETLRAKLGPGVKIGAVLDLHVNLSDRMLSAADLLIGCKEYPHDDFLTSCDTLVDLMYRMQRGEIRPVTRYFDCRMIGLFGTKSGAMKEYVEQFRALEDSGEILQAWTAHGFPWADTPDTSFKVVVTTDGDVAKALDLSRSIGMDMYANRRAFPMTIHQPGEMHDIDWDPKNGPMVLGDISDNPMGGAPGDATFLLRHLIDHETRPVAFSTIYDPGLVAALASVAVGETAAVSLGGKVSIHSGTPIEADALILGKYPAHSVVVDGPMFGGQASFKLGDTVVLRIGCVDIVVASYLAQPVSPAFFSAAGLTPENYAILAVKSTQHFATSFAEIAGAIGYISTPGALAQNYDQLSYAHLDMTSIWPLVDNPLQVEASMAPARA
ncbi:MAG: M81 family metallopeptidase [Pseudomonadota bacterium]